MQERAFESTPIGQFTKTAYLVLRQMERGLADQRNAKVYLPDTPLHAMDAPRSTGFTDSNGLPRIWLVYLLVPRMATEWQRLNGIEGIAAAIGFARGIDGNASDVVFAMHNFNANVSQTLGPVSLDAEESAIRDMVDDKVRSFLGK